MPSKRTPAEEFSLDDLPTELHIQASYEIDRDLDEEELVWEEIQAAADDGEDKKKLPLVKMKAYTGGPMQLTGFFHPVVVDLAGYKPSNAKMPFFRDHDPNKIVGHGSTNIGATELTAEGVISAENEHSDDVLKSSANGFPWQVSLGATGTEFEFVEKGESTQVNGRTVKGPVVVARKSVGNEMSFVPLGADRRTKASIKASRKTPKSNPKRKKGTVMDDDFKQWLEASDYEPDELTDKQLKPLKAAFEAEVQAAADGDPPPHSDSFQQIIGSTKAERNRVDQITQLVAHFVHQRPEQVDEIEKLGEAAIKSKSTTPETFELEMHRTLRPAGPANVSARNKDGQLTSKVIEAAICQSCRLPDIDKKFDEQTLDAADKEFRGSIGLQQLLFRAAAQNGQHFDSANNVEALLKAAFGQNQPLRASGGFSTFSLPGILSNSMNKFLEVYFMHVEQAWRPITKIRPVRDFKQISSYALTGDMQYEQIGPTGELPHGTLSEETYNNQAKTYGRMLAITRNDIINDDLGALEQVPQRLGRGGALKINDIFWTEFMDNSSFFTAGRGNYDDGTDTVLDIDGLTNAETLFFNQTDPDGKPLGVMPKILLVPPGHNAEASNLMQSTQYRDTTANTKFGTNNPHAGKWSVVMSTYLANSSYTGNSALAWYLLADPMDMPVIELCFLNGRDMPIVESADANFNTLGIQVRAYHDFGVAKQEYRGGVKMKGEA